MAHVNPSQNSPDKAPHAWVRVKQDRDIITLYCTCMAGYDLSSYHINTKGYHDHRLGEKNFIQLQSCSRLNVQSCETMLIIVTWKCFGYSSLRSSCGSRSYDTRIVVRDINALRCFAYSFTLMTTEVFSCNGRFIYFILARCMLNAIITRVKMWFL